MVWMDEGGRRTMQNSKKSGALCAIQLIRDHGPEVRASMSENDDEDY